MNARQAAFLMAAQRTDAPTPFALSVPSDMQALVAQVFHATQHANATDLHIVARPTEEPMPAEVAARIQDALAKEPRP